MFRSRLAVKLGLLIAAVLALGFGARDELGELGDAFNEMTSRLARAHAYLAAKNTEETAGDGLMAIFQSERGGTDHVVDATRAAFAIPRRTATGPATAGRIRAHFVLESLGEKSFKNVSQPIRVFRAVPPGVYEKVL